MEYIDTIALGAAAGAAAYVYFTTMRELAEDVAYLLAKDRPKAYYQVRRDLIGVTIISMTIAGGVAAGCVYFLNWLVT